MSGSKSKSIEDIYALTSLQEGIHFHVDAEPESPIYWNQFVAQLKGEVDAMLFRQAWQSVIDRYAVLRTGFVRNKQGRILQLVSSHASLPWTYEDWSNLSTSEQEAHLDEYLAKDLIKLPDLRRSPLMRVALFKKGEGSYQFLWSLHHIILDGWSGATVFQAVFDSYKRLTEGLNPVESAAASFSDYIKWLQSKDRDQAKIFWTDYFADYSENRGLLESIKSDGKPQRRISEKAKVEDYSRLTHQFSQVETEAITQFASTCRVTLSTLVQAAWSLVLAAESGETKVTYGVTIADRPPEVSSIEDIVGLLLATVPVNVDIETNCKLDQWLQQNQQQFADVCAHNASLVDIHTWSGRPRSKELFDSLLVFENYFYSENMALAANLKIGEVKAYGMVNYPLTVVVVPAKELSLELSYLNLKIPEQFAERIMQRLRFMLNNLCIDAQINLNQLSLIMDSEYQQLQKWNTTTETLPYNSVSHWFEEIASQYGNKNAVCFYDVEDKAFNTHHSQSSAIQFSKKSLTYTELDHASTALACSLLEHGLKHDDRVAVALPRSEMLPVALLGVFKAGASYLPIDVRFPLARVEYMLTDSSCRFLLTDESVDSIPVFSGKRINLDGLGLFEELKANAAQILADTQKSDSAYLNYTSGSTGRPKGVCIGQKQLVNLLYSMSQTPGLTSSDDLLAVTTLSFDISVLELLGPLMVGATVGIAASDVANDGCQLNDLITALKPSVVQATPVTWSMLLAAEWMGHPDLKILCGGESLDKHLAGQLLERAGSLWNMYGPTETTVWSTCGQVKGLDQTITVGKPIANTQLRVLNANQQDLPFGASGELYIGGAGLAECYWQRESLTKEKFTALKSKEDVNKLWFKTGDIACWNALGEIEIFGRKDGQIKVRGYRIEPEEIEVCLCQIPSIRECCVVLRKFQSNDMRLVAFYIDDKSAATNVELLREHLGRTLPAYMIPQNFCELDSFPLTPNAKIDRAALLARELNQKETPSRSSSARLPDSETGRYYYRLWQELLCKEKVEADATFFDNGGHSLLSMQFVAHVAKDHNIDIPLNELRVNTLNQLAKVYSTEQQDETNNDRATQSSNGTLISGMAVSKQREEFPLSPFQQRLWLLNKIEGAASTHNLMKAFFFGSGFQPERMINALQRLTQSHEILRTHFSFSGEKFIQCVSPDSSIDCQTLEKTNESELLVLLESYLKHNFDLENGPLWFVRIIPYADGWIVAMNFHHGILDGESIPVLLKILSHYYRTPDSLENYEPGLQYGDYATWQCGINQHKDYQKSKNYWLGKLSDKLPVLDFPSDASRPLLQDFSGTIESICIDQDLTQSLKSLAQNENTTMFNVLLSAAYISLARYTGQTDIVFGVPVSTRDHFAEKNMLGPYVNTIALRLDVDIGQSAKDLLSFITQQTLDGLAHKIFPFEDLLSSLSLNRDPGRTPVFQILFAYRNDASDKWEIPGVEVGEYPLDQRLARTDISWWIDAGNEIDLALEYACAVIDGSIIKQMLEQLQSVLFEMTRQIDAKPAALITLPRSQYQAFVAQNELRDQLFSNNGMVTQMISQQATETPENIALVFPAGAGGLVSYSSLERRSNQLAHFLLEQGVKSGSLVGICVDRSDEMLLYLLAILKAGCAYVPLDPEYPVDRLLYMAKDAGLKYLLTRDEYAAWYPGEIQVLLPGSHVDDISSKPVLSPDVVILPENTAYVIYTSGSTGKPNGVKVPHRALGNFLNSMAHKPGLQSNDCLLAITTVSFDIAVLELFLPLIVGAKILIASKDEAQDARKLIALINDYEVSCMQATPATWQMMLSSGWNTGQAIKALCGGEALAPDLAAALFENCKEVWNMYGPTESTVWSSCMRMDSKSQLVGLGEPIANTHFYVMDEFFELLPKGVSGELFIGGEGVTDGYLNRTDLNANRFIEHSLAGAGKLYRTGDKVRYRNDGSLEYLGRLDNQVKLRGFRIELGEIEAVMRQLPEVSECALAVQSLNGQQDARLIAYIVWQRNSLTLTEIRQHLQNWLPRHMSPQLIIELDELPRTANGKLDRKGLPDTPEPISSESEHKEPLTAESKWLAALWGDMLGIKNVGLYDNFFDLGGHSLLSMQVIYKVGLEFQVDLNPRDLLLDTLDQVAAKLEAKQVGGDVESTLDPVAKTGKRKGLFQRFFG